MSPTSPAAFDFRTYRVVVAGGSRGIGRSIAIATTGAVAHAASCDLDGGPLLTG